MALKGNIQDFSITQLFNLINLAQKTGMLIVECNNGATTVYFQGGKLAYAHTGRDDNSLVTILHKAEKLSAAQHKAIKQRAGNMSDKELGLLLINANYISRQDIITSLQNYFIHVVDQLFILVDGIFRFETNTVPPKDKITVRVNLENLILEGSRHKREWEHLQDEIPSLDMALKFADRPGGNIRNVNLSVDEWRVVSYILPKNSMRQIAKVTKLNDIEIRKIIYSLLQAGLVEIVRPLDSPQISAPSRQISVSTTTNKEEQKSLIDRIITRIRSL